MRLLAICAALLLLLLLSLSAPAARATEASPARCQWQSIVTGKPLAVTIYAPAAPHGDAPLSLVLYLKNLAAPRTGTESDAAILRDLRAAGYLVATVDFGWDPKARIPYLNRDLGKLRDDLRAHQFLSQYRIDDAHIFLIPEGSRLMRDVVFYPAADRTLAMDIVYPSKPERPVGAVLEFSCDNKDRMGNTSLSICSDTLLDAEATEGFAVAMADHPVAPPYKGLDPMDDCAWKIRAAVRTLRAQSAALVLNGRIVPVGFSRGSGMALMLVTSDSDREFEGHVAHPDVSSTVQGAVVLSGRFTYLDLLPDDHMLPRYTKAWGDRETHTAVWKHQGALDYLTHAAAVPLFLSIDRTESPDALHQMDVLRRHLTELGSAYTFQMDPEPRGHKVTLVPSILDTMNRYLKSRLQ